MKISVWKDRPNRTRVMALLGNGKHMDARRYYYQLYYPNEDIKGYRILQLDMNPFNFDKDNLVKVTPQVMNRLLNNKLLSDDIELNKKAIKYIELEIGLDNVLKGEGK